MTKNKNSKSKKQAKNQKTGQQKVMVPMSQALVVRSSPQKTLVSRPNASAALRGGLQAPQNRKMQSKMKLPQFLIAQVDAFCPEAFGVKVPDEATMPSAVAFSRDLLPISIGATFAGAGAAFRFNAGAAIVLPTPTSSTSWTWPLYAVSTPVSNQAALTANFDLLRTAAFAIKIETRQSAFAAAGFVHIAILPENMSGTNWGYPTSVGAMEYAPYYKRVPLADLIYDEITVQGKYTDSTAFRYLLTNSDTANDYITPFIATGWSAILVWVEAPGLSISNALDVEMIHHYEGLTQSTAASSGVIEATAAAPTSPAVMAATAFVADRVDPVQVNAEDEENKGSFWGDVGNLFKMGLGVASGVFPVLAPISSIVNKLF